jgi:hypothetical protein
MMAMQSRSRAVLSRWRYFLVGAMSSVLLVLAACGSDDASDDDAGIAAEPTATEQVAETPTPQPDPTETPAADDTSEADDAAATPTAPPEPTPTPEPDESIDDGDTEPTPDVDFAPELAGLTDWRNADPVTLEDLRGEPVILVFWNSI